jgi:hypothetical protein
MDVFRFLLSIPEALRYALRWTRLLLAVGSTALRTHERLQRQIRGCIVCARVFFPGDSFYTCSLCEESHDLCDTCFQKRTVTTPPPPTAICSRSSRLPLENHPMHVEELPVNTPLLPPWHGKRQRESSPAVLVCTASDSYNDHICYVCMHAFRTQAVGRY